MSSSYCYGDDEQIVNYRDAVLYGRDLKILEDPISSSRWLNDELVNYQMLRLLHAASAAERQVVPNESGTHQVPTDPVDLTVVSTSRELGRSPFLGMDPSVLSFMMNLETDDDEEWLEELASIAASHNSFKGVQLIFLPVNDGMCNGRFTCSPAIAASRLGAAQGTHWSLLVAVVVGTEAGTTSAMDGVGSVALNGTIAKQEQQQQASEEALAPSSPHLAYLHFDSVPGHNADAAQALAANWDRLWRSATLRTAKTSTTTSSLPPHKRDKGGTDEEGTGCVSVRECRAPSQSNGYDCGLHVLASVEALLNIATTGDSGSVRSENQLQLLVQNWEQALARHFGNDPARVCSVLRRQMANDIRSLGTAKRD